MIIRKQIEINLQTGGMKHESLREDCLVSFPTVRWRLWSSVFCDTKGRIRERENLPNETPFSRYDTPVSSSGHLSGTPFLVTGGRFSVHTFEPSPKKIGACSKIYWHGSPPWTCLSGTIRPKD